MRKVVGYCKQHQGDGKHYNFDNCTVCQLSIKVSQWRQCYEEAAARICGLEAELKHLQAVNKELRRPFAKVRQIAREQTHRLGHLLLKL